MSRGCQPVGTKTPLWKRGRGRNHNLFHTGRLVISGTGSRIHLGGFESSCHNHRRHKRVAEASERRLLLEYVLGLPPWEQHPAEKVTTCTVQSMKSDHAAAFALSEEDKRRADAAMHGAKKTYAQGATVYVAT